MFSDADCGGNVPPQFTIGKVFEMKRGIALLTAVSMLAGPASGGQDPSGRGTDGSFKYTSVSGAESTAPENNDPYVVMTPDPLVPELVEKFFPGYTADISVTNAEVIEENLYSASGHLNDTEIQWVIIMDDSDYYDYLDVLLVDQSTGERTGLIDLFVVGADMADKYVSSEADVACALKNDLNIRNSELKNQFEYTKILSSDEHGVQRGVMFEATPGVFAYRRSIAKDVLGTDDPEEVQKAVADWESFDDTAKKMHAKGWKMLAGPGDAFECVEQNKEIGWYDEQGDLHIAKSLQDWVATTKEYCEKGYNAGAEMWTEAWHAETGKDGKTFGFFISADEIDPFIAGALSVTVSDGGKAVEGNGSFGDWAICAGPGRWQRGGSLVCAAAGSSHTELSANLMRFLACDEGTMSEMAAKKDICVNNKAVLKKLSDAEEQGVNFWTSIFRRGACGSGVTDKALSEAEDARDTLKKGKNVSESGQSTNSRHTSVRDDRGAAGMSARMQPRESTENAAGRVRKSLAGVPEERSGRLIREQSEETALLSAESVISLTESGEDASGSYEADEESGSSGSTEIIGNTEQPGGGADTSAADAGIVEDPNAPGADDTAVEFHTDTWRAFFGGQDIYSVFADAGEGIEITNVVSYEVIFGILFESAYLEYFSGKVSEQEAMTEYYQNAKLFIS